MHILSTVICMVLRASARLTPDAARSTMVAAPVSLHLCSKLACMSVAAALLAGPARAYLQEPGPATTLQELDRTVRPQDDLFRHVNGRWLASMEVPAEKVNYDTFSELGDRVEADLRAIIEEVAAVQNKRQGSSAQQIGDLYASLMDEARIESIGITPVRAQLDKIESIRTPREFAEEAGRLSAIGVGGPFGGNVAVEPTTGELIVHLSQSGILLPDRDYYLTDNPRYIDARGQYVDYLARIFALAGRANVAAEARAVLALETELARHFLGRDFSLRLHVAEGPRDLIDLLAGQAEDRKSVV